MLQPLYRGLTGILMPVIVPPLLVMRGRKGLEDRARRGERYGRSARPRPEGPLVWIHAASVGEALSVRVLIDRLLARDARLTILLTTWTVTAARMMEERVPDRVVHQYLPYDRPRWVRRFLDHWRPDLAIWVESELWPNLVADAFARRVPMALVNGRMSPRSFRRWRRVPGFCRRMLGAFRVIMPGDAASARHFEALGAPGLGPVGNVKFSADPPAATAEAVAALSAACGERPVWLALSTHGGEDAALLDTHRALAAKHPGLLTLLAPRHPRRRDEVEALARERGLRVALRSQAGLPQAQDEVFLVDTLGETGLMLRMAAATFVGGSLIPFGGHNPIEPAQLGSPILYGPHMFNFADIAAELEAAGGARRVADGAALVAALDRLLSDPAARRRQAEAAAEVAARNRDVIARVMATLEPLLVSALRRG